MSFPVGSLMGGNFSGMISPLGGGIFLEPFSPYNISIHLLFRAGHMSQRGTFSFENVISNK